MALDIRDQRVQKFAFVFLILGLVLYTYFLTDWMPFTYKANASELNKLENQYRELSKDLAKARQAVDQLPYLEKEYELLHDKWEQGQELLPDDEGMIELLRQITVLGTNSGIDFLKFEPKEAKPARGYTEVPIEISVTGGYHQVGTLLAELANMTRIINVRGLDVQAPKKQGKNAENRATTASFVAVAYKLGGLPPDAPEEDGPSTKKTKAKRRSQTSKKSSNKSSRSSQGDGE